MSSSNASPSSQSFTTTDSESSSTSSLCSDASLELSDTAQHIFSLHGKNLQPLSNSTKNPQTSTDKEDELHEIAVRELGRKVHGVPMEWAATLCRGTASDDEIAKFIELEASGFDIGRNVWAGLPTDPTDFSQVREPLVKIASTIVRHFYPCPPAGIAREVVDSHQVQLVHDNGRYYSQPAIVIQAKGPSFEVPEHANGPDALGYTNVAAVIEVQIDNAKGSRRKQAAQLAICCRQMFLQQPNRHFSQCLMVSEKQFRLIHYDRSGVYVTPSLDIHQDKEIFIRLILGLSSLDEGELGFDVSVQWTIDPASGKKVAGTVKVDEYDEETKTPQSVSYNLNMEEPPFVRPGIHGRGTTAWRATHPTTGEALLIKDSWQTSSRSAECEYLLAAKGIPGVVQLVGYQDRCAETIKYRPFDFKAPHFENRIKRRVVVKKYGTCISQFTSRLSLVCALRDAIIGHRKLLDRKILHRDISVQNILFGRADAGEGERGILIDLDLAAWTENGVSPVPTDPRVGTRQYQSIAVCRSHIYDLPAPQSYLDELESFFYILVHIMFSFHKPRTVPKPQPLFLELWATEDASQSGDRKIVFAMDVIPTREIPAFWGRPCRTLLKQFQSVIQEILRKGMDIRYDEDTTDDEKLEAYHEQSQESDRYFQRVVSAFDTAIDSLKEEGLNADEIAAIAKYPAPTLPSHSRPESLVPITPCNVPPSENISDPAVFPASEKAVTYSSNKNISSGRNKKRTLDDDLKDSMPQKRHCNEDVHPAPTLASEGRSQSLEP